VEITGATQQHVLPPPAPVSNEFLPDPCSSLSSSLGVGMNADANVNVNTDVHVDVGVDVTMMPPFPLDDIAPMHVSPVLKGEVEGTELVSDEAEFGEFLMDAVNWL
jgi:hypothetical protein